VKTIASEKFQARWHEIDWYTPKLYITELFLGNQNHQDAYPKLPGELALFANLQLLRLFSDFVGTKICQTPALSVGQVYDFFRKHSTTLSKTQWTRDNDPSFRAHATKMVRDYTSEELLKYFLDNTGDLPDGTEYPPKDRCHMYNDGEPEQVGQVYFNMTDVEHAV
jgi:hypothetical protein